MKFDPTGRPPHELGPSFVPWLNVQNAPFRARGDGSTHDKIAINNAIEEMAATVPSSAGETFGGGGVFLPRGHYSIDDITMQYGVRVRGEGPQATKLIARSGSAAHGMILLASGVVAYSWLEDLALIGDPGNTGQHGLYLHSDPTMQAGATQGGWWNSGLRNITVGLFDGEQIWLHGGDDSFEGPNQFLTFDHVEADCVSTSRRALRLTGQVDHLKCLGACRFDGPGFGAGGTNILLERTVDPTTFANNGDNAPHGVEFIGITCQSNSTGIEVQRAQNVTIMHNHFEALHNGVLVNTSAKNVVVANNDFANTGHDGSGTGYGVKSTNAHAIVRDNYFAYGTTGGFGQPDTHYVRDTGGLLDVQGTYHRDDNGVKTSALFLQINAASTIDVTGFNHVLVNTSATAITTITSNYSVPGNFLSVKAHNGPITLSSGGNIYFDSTPNRYKSPLIVPQDTMILFIRMNLSGSEIWYILAGAENANYVRPFGCNGATPQTSFSVPVPPSTGGTGVTAGAFDSAGHRDALIATVSALRAMAIANGAAM